MSTRTKRNVYSDLRIKLVVRIMVKKKWGYGFLTSIVVRRSDDKEYEFSYADLPRLTINNVENMYLLQVQDKLHHLLLELVKDFNNALLLFIRRVVIQNRVEDIQLRVENYQQTLNLTKPMMFFEGINQKIPFTMSGTHKGIHENLVDMVKKNKLGTDNKRLKGRDLTDKVVEKSNEMVNKIDKTLKRREQLRKLEELVLSIIAREDLHLDQYDVKTAFLHGNLDEDIYMTQPEGFQSAGKEENIVAGLRHGRDQEAQETVVSRIRDEGFRLRKADSRHEHH
ncbi:transmembrane protein [Tanacetum coccineum]